MGGSPNLLMPVSPAYTASWSSHTRRSPRSTEPGTDMFVPIGTPVYAPADGVIYGHGNSIGPATGRWVGIDFDNGLRFRCMHHSRLVRTSGRVRRGDLIAYSGASGYGYEDWSRLSTMPAAHTHVTLWPSQSTRFGYDRNGVPYTVDFMKYVGGSAVAGGGAVVAPPKDEEVGLDMSQVRYVHRVEKGYSTEWMIAGMELPGGFMTTTDETTAVGWGALYGTDKGDSWKALNRKQYVQLQTTAAELNRRWVAQMKSLRS